MKRIHAIGVVLILGLLVVGCWPRHVAIAQAPTPVTIVQGGIVVPVTANGLKVDASFSGANAAAGATGGGVPASASYTGLNIGGNLIGQTGFSLGTARAAATVIVDGSGNQITSFGSSAAVGSTGAAVPASANYHGLNIGGNLTGQTGFSVGTQRAAAVALVDAAGNQITTLGGSGQVDNSAFTQGTTTETVAGGLYTTSYTNATSGRATVWQMTIDGQGYVNLGKIAGTATSVNNGTVDAGTQRVAIASNNTAFTVNLGTTAGGAGQLALDATLTGGTQKAILRGGAKGSTTAADVTSTASGANHQPIDVVVYDVSGNPITSFTGSGSNAAASATGSAVPASADYLGLNVAGTLRGQTGVNPSGSIFAGQVDLASIAGATPGATNPVPVRITDGTAFISLSNDATTNTASQTSGPQIFLTGSAAVPTAVGADGRSIAYWGDTVGRAHVTGDSGMTALLVQPGPSSASGNAVSDSGCTITTTASTNAQSCKTAATNIYGWEIYNTTTTIYYLRFYNVATTPSCNSATGFYRPIPIQPAGAAGSVGGTVIDYGNAPIRMSTGLGWCITAGAGSTDNTNAASGIYGTVRAS